MLGLQTPCTHLTSNGCSCCSREVASMYSNNTQSQPTLSSQASEPAAMKTRPLGAATGPALWTVPEGASEGGDGTDRGQQIAGDGGSGDGLNSDQEFGVLGQTSDVEVIQTLQSIPTAEALSAISYSLRAFARPHSPSSFSRCAFSRFL